MSIFEAEAELNLLSFSEAEAEINLESVSKAEAELDLLLVSEAGPESVCCRCPRGEAEFYIFAFRDFLSAAGYSALGIHIKNDPGRLRQRGKV